MRLLRELVTFNIRPKIHLVITSCNDKIFLCNFTTYHQRYTQLYTFFSDLTLSNVSSRSTKCQKR